MGLEANVKEVQNKRLEQELLVTFQFFPVEKVLLVVLSHRAGPREASRGTRA